MEENPIKAWREGAGYGIEQMANLMGYTGKHARTVWWRWEIGLNGVPLEVISKIEALSEGRITFRDWLNIRRAYKAAHPVEKAAA